MVYTFQPGKSMTIRDIAEEAGVSVATVSRLINNIRVRSNNAQKIQSVIKKYNYHPNSIAQSLKNNATRTIGFLVSDISNDYLIGLGKVIEDIISKKGYNIIVCSTDGLAEREITYLNMLMSKKVDAIILNTTGLNYDYVAKISRQIPLVLLHRRNVKSRFKGDFVDCDNYYGSFLLTEHFLLLGHRKIGCVLGPLMLSTASERLRGFEDALKKYGALPEKNPYLIFTEFTYKGGYEAAAKLLCGEIRPTAIITMNNATTLGALKYFLDHNIRIPDECSIANFGTIQRNELLYVQPTYVTLDTKEIGEMLAEAVLSRIENFDIKNREYFYRPRLITGNAEKQIGEESASR
jgi:LacI family transcriptional regulator